MQVELQETEPLAQNQTDNPLSQIKVIMETEARQTDTFEGLRFLFLFMNAGQEAVEFQQPDDAIQLELLNDEGWPVPLPFRRVAALINTREKPGPHPNAPQILKLQAGQQYFTTLVVRQRLATDSAIKVDLERGNYKVTAMVVLLAADPGLERERAYRVLRSKQLTIEFGS